MINDIVKIIDSYCTTLGWTFSYGNKANQNLLQSAYNVDLENKQVYLLLDPPRRTREFSEFGGTGKKIYKGAFLLVVQSDIDEVYYEQGGDITKSKYEKNIRPLLETELPRIEDLLNCSDYEIELWEVVDATDMFDANTDGLTVTYTISIL